MFFILFLCFLHVVLAVPLTTLSSERTVNTTSGPLIGHKSPFSESFKYLGVPFAEPPLGNLRWRNPKPVSTPFAVPTRMDKLPPSCIQTKNTLAWGATSEDCLYLNIYTPINTNTSNPLPVMVWFYGGSWEYGGTSIPLYDGEFDAAHNNVILVTVNYRLGALGFLGSSELIGEGDAAGNFGIADQQMALKWVQENIEGFGGDKNRVTIFGESAGGGSVAVHLVAESSRGLFHRAIMESGPFSGWTCRSLSDAQAAFDYIAQSTGCSNSTSLSTSPSSIISCLRGMNASDLVHISPPSASATGWSPVVDGVFLRDDPQILVQKGEAADVPVMLGTNANEATTLIHLDSKCTTQDYIDWVIKTFGSDFAPQILSLYPVEKYDTPWYAGVQAWTDWGMACPARRSARWLSSARLEKEKEKTSSVFLYQFQHEPEITQIFEKKNKCFHGAEIAFVFRFLPLDTTPGEQKLASAMSSMWANFAASGDPNVGAMETDLIGKVPVWPAYSNTTDQNYVFQTGLVELALAQNSGLRKEFCDFWDQHPTYH